MHRFGPSVVGPNDLIALWVSHAKERVVVDQTSPWSVENGAETFPVSAKMPVWFHPLYTDGIHPDARFPRDRYRALARRLQQEHVAPLVRIERAPQAHRDDLVLAHSGTYVDRFIEGKLDPKEVRRIGLRPWTPLLIPRTLHIMGGAIAALRSATKSKGLAGNMAGGTHHAHRGHGSGYCVFNDLAVCARLAVQRLGFERVAIIDLDVHQGDGTATILADDPSVRTISVHCGENFPFRKAESDFDISVPSGTADQSYLEAVEQAVLHVLEFEPDLLLYQAGVDGLETDALGRLNLSRVAMRERNRKVFEAVIAIAVPCVVFMGGGYSNPIGPTVDAFNDLFVDAARTHQHRLAREQQSLTERDAKSAGSGDGMVSGR